MISTRQTSEQEREGVIGEEALRSPSNFVARIRIGLAKGLRRRITLMAATIIFVAEQHFEPARRFGWSACTKDPRKMISI